MRLDNRTRVILVTGEQAGGAPVKEYFEGTGGNVGVVDGGVKVGYPTREMAERVSLSSGYLQHSRALSLSVRNRFTQVSLLGRRKETRADSSGTQVLAMGTKEIPSLSGPISATWYNPTETNGNGAGDEVEMVETETRRGDHDEED